MPNLPAVLSPSLIFILLGSSAPAAAQRAACDTNLIRLAGASNGYRDRGTRCEGTYAQTIGGNTLKMVSFTETFLPYRTETRDTMRVEWPATAGDSVRLRAEALRRREYYRMDAVQAGNGSFLWPSRLLVNEGIRGSDVGIVGWTTSRVQGRETELFIPLRVRIGSSPLTCGVYTVTLLPGQRLDEVTTTLTQMDARGRPGARVRDHTPVGRGPYPAEVAIPFRITRNELPAPGVYLLRVDVRLSGGGTSSLDRYLTLGDPCQP